MPALRSIARTPPVYRGGARLAGSSYAGRPVVRTAALVGKASGASSAVMGRVKRIAPPSTARRVMRRL